MSATGYLARAMARAYPCLALSFPSMRRHVQPSPFFPLNVVLLGSPHWYTQSEAMSFSMRMSRRRFADNVRQSNTLLARLEKLR